MCYEPSRSKFDLWFLIISNLDLEYRERLKWEQKKRALSYYKSLV
jgi:hypothetical protein